MACAYVHVCAYAFMCVDCVYVCTCACCVCVCLYVCMYVHICVCMCMFDDVGICVCIYVCVSVGWVPGVRLLSARDHRGVDEDVYIHLPQRGAQAGVRP